MDGRCELRTAEALVVTWRILILLRYWRRADVWMHISLLSLKIYMTENDMDGNVR